MSFITTPCVLHRATGTSSTDAHGNETTDREDIDTFCDLQQVAREEQPDQGENSDTLWDLFLLAGTNLGATPTANTITVKARKYEFVGDPWEADSASPEIAHVAATVRRTT